MPHQSNPLVWRALVTVVDNTTIRGWWEWRQWSGIWRWGRRTCWAQCACEAQWWSGCWTCMDVWTLSTQRSRSASDFVLQLFTTLVRHNAPFILKSSGICGKLTDTSLFLWFRKCLLVASSNYYKMDVLSYDAGQWKAVVTLADELELVLPLGGLCVFLFFFPSFICMIQMNDITVFLPCPYSKKRWNALPCGSMYRSDIHGHDEEYRGGECRWSSCRTACMHPHNGLYAVVLFSHSHQREVEVSWHDWTNPDDSGT